METVLSGAIARVNQGGNYCGHIPQDPDFAILRPVSVGRGGHPRILTKLLDRVTQYYASPRLRIPSLDQANGSTRQQRSERREACLRLLGAIIRNTDLSSLRIGQPTAEGFINYGVRFLAVEARLGYRRAERAFQDLVSAGLINTSEKQPRQYLENGECRGLNKPKLVSPLLFSIFGLGNWLAFEKKKKTNQLKRKAEELSKSGKPTTLTSMTRFKLFTGALSNKLGGVTKKGKKPAKVTQRQAEQNGEYQRQYNILLYELKIAFPDKSGDEIKRIANSRLAGLKAV